MTQEQQGQGIEMKYVLESYMSVAANLTRENALLKAHNLQLESQLAQAKQGTPEEPNK